jgi:2-dehydro-3-deoxygluconokinase
VTSPAPAPAEVVCIGESMAVLVPEQHGPLEGAERFHRGVGGAESNVARGLAALGVPAAWISRVGRDGFGRLLLAELEADGVDTSAVELDPHRATGLYVKEIGGGTGSPHDLGPGNSRLHYYRTGSAASALGPDTLAAPRAAALLAAARIVHLSGITAALGRLTGEDGGRRLVESVLERRRPGQLVSFDLNWRPRLWHRPPGPPGPAEPSQPTEILADLADRADVVLLGTDEAAEVFGTARPEELRGLLPNPRILVVKDAERGVSAFDRELGPEPVTERALRVEVVEPIGAGDAFAAGYLAGLLRGHDQRRRLRLGHVCAATALMVRADHATPPAPETLAALLDGPETRWAATFASGGEFTVPEGAAP